MLFLLSVPNSLKQSLLRSADLLVYTPSNEHFGIVPLEAMLAGVPVLAADSGGPRETVVEGVTGWLRDPEKVEDWTRVMEKALYGLSPGETQEMSRAGRERVKGNFAVGQMAKRLDELFAEVDGAVKKQPRGARASVVGLGVVGSLMAVAGGWIMTMGIAMRRT